MENGSSRTQVPIGWRQGLSDPGLEVRLLPGAGLVLIDRHPCIVGDPARWMSDRIKGPAGTYANVVEEARPYALNGLGENETMLHSVHGGFDGGVAVVVDQYLLLREDRPACLVRLVTPVNGRGSLDGTTHHDLLMRFMDRNTPEPPPIRPTDR